MDPLRVIGHVFEESLFEYTERDAALYALGVGASGALVPGSFQEVSRSGSGGEQDKEGVTELCYAAPRIISSEFKVLPTFAVLFPASALDQVLSLEGLKFDPALLLHGEHFLQLHTPSLPAEAKVVSSGRIAGLMDKGKSAVVELETSSRDADSGMPLAVNCATIVLRGAGGFESRLPAGGGVLHASWRTDPLKLTAKAPPQAPVATLSQRIPPTQALVYRLSGDYNPLHADPPFAASAGFAKPILHGLCTLGYACRAVLHAMAQGAEPSAIRRVKTRFLSHVFPGENLTTRIWRDESSGGSNLPGTFRVVLLASVERDGKERLVLTAAVELAPSDPYHLAWAVTHQSRL